MVKDFTNITMNEWRIFVAVKLGLNQLGLYQCCVLEFDRKSLLFKNAYPGAYDFGEQVQLSNDQSIVVLNMNKDRTESTYGGDKIAILLCSKDDTKKVAQIYT
jgi:hypothetical protein